MKVDAKRSVTLITGPEGALRREALQALFASAGVAPDDMEVETRIADASPPGEWIGAASVSPFLAERRVVVVRNLLRVDPGKADEKHALVGQLRSLPPTGLLVLVTDDESGDESKQRTLTDVRQRWEKLVSFADGSVIQCKANPANVVNDLQSAASAGGKKMSPKAAKTLAEMVAGRLSQGLAEVEKLVLFVGAQDEIREEDIRRLVSPEREYKVFDLINAVVAANPRDALREVRTLFGQTDRIENEVFPRVFPLLVRQFRLIWQGKVLLDHGASPTSVPAEVMALLPASNITRESEYAQRNVMAQARRLSYEQVALCLEQLVDADAKLKGLRPAFTAIETIEQMVLRMCDICTGRSVASVR